MKDVKSRRIVPETIRPIKFNNSKRVPTATEKLKHLPYLLKSYRELTCKAGCKAERIVSATKSPVSASNIALVLSIRYVILISLTLARNIHQRWILRSYFHLPYQLSSQVDMHCLNKIIIKEKRCVVSILVTTVEFIVLKKIGIS